jgi:hypothetical protein
MHVQTERFQPCNFYSVIFKYIDAIYLAGGNKSSDSSMGNRFDAPAAQRLLTSTSFAGNVNPGRGAIDPDQPNIGVPPESTSLSVMRYVTGGCVVVRAPGVFGRTLLGHEHEIPGLPTIRSPLRQHA